MNEGIQHEENIPPAETVPKAPLSELLREVTDDPELVQFFSENSDLPLNPDGTSSIARDPFQLASHIALHDEEKAHRFIDLLADHGFLPELHYEYQSDGLSELELSHKLNLNRFESARESFYYVEKTPLEKTIVSRSIAYLDAVRASFGLKKLNNVEQYVDVYTEPLDKKSEGFGLTVPETPLVVVDTPEDISTLKFTFHELAHISAYTMCTFTKDKDGDIIAQFSNIGLSSLVGLDDIGRMIRNFRTLNEAVTEEFSKRFIQSLQNEDADFGEIIKEQRSKIELYRENHPNELRDEDWEDVVAIHELPDGTQYPVQYTYREERLVLKQLLAEMSRRLLPEYPGMSEGEVQELLFQALVKAEFTGDLKEFENAFIKVFGEEAYKKYSSSTSLLQDVEVLRSLGIPGLEGNFKR